MTRRILASVAWVALALLTTHCNQIFGLEETHPAPPPNSHYAGCFMGPITDPPSSGVITVVFEAPQSATLNLTGCMRGTIPSFNATFAGAVTDNPAEAQIVAMPQGFSAFAVRVEAQLPSHFDDATSVSLFNLNGAAPFRQAANLARCNLSCADLGLSQSFGPGVAQ